jgi:outer membrane protein OmpA-like peptidoglycan-associated protein
MKKLVLFFAAAAMAVSASAQVTVEGSKLTDNIYVGINGGVGVVTTHNKWMKNLMPNFGVRVGKNITPIFGIAIDGTAYMGLRQENPLVGNSNVLSTGFKAVNTSVLGTVNFNNLICGYKGEPRAFEVTGLFGIGWFHTFGSHNGTRLMELPLYIFDQAPLYGTANDRAVIVDNDDKVYVSQNKLSSKVALNFAYNFGSAKQWQVYVEPSMTWIFGNHYHVTRPGVQTSDPAYDINHSIFGVNAGLVYKFKNSNGTHNFKIAQLRDQAEIDELNRIINELRNRKPEVVTKEVVKEVVKEVSIDDLVFVTFAQGKYNLTNEAKAALDKVKEGAHVQIVGTASPEGSKELNDRLSQNRANVVADYLKGRGVVVDEAIGKGVQGTTSNRLAIVYVK